MAREHDNRQPFIENELIDAIKSYSCVTYRQLSGHINHWCRHGCIAAWLHSHPTYSLYAKNIKPGLTPENQMKQVAFSRRVMQRWGLAANTKILWVHLDEKWFHGIVPRTNAKAFAQNWGLPKRVIAPITRNTLPRSWHIVVLGIYSTGR